MNSAAFDSINVSEDNEQLCADFATMCDALNVRISNVAQEWRGSMYSQDDTDQLISGDVERIGNNGTFRFYIGDLYDDWGHSLVGVMTGFSWNGDPALGTRRFVLEQGANFYVHTTNSPSMHVIYDLGSVLSIGSIDEAGQPWIDRYPEEAVAYRRTPAPQPRMHDVQEGLFNLTMAE